MMYKPVLENFLLVCSQTEIYKVIMYSVVGSSLRLCEYGGIWLEPNVSSCATQQFIDIRNMVIYNVLLQLQFNSFEFCRQRH